MRLIKRLTPLVFIGLGKAIDDVAEDSLEAVVEDTDDNIPYEALQHDLEYQAEIEDTFEEMIENTVKKELGDSPNPDRIEIDEDGMSNIQDDRVPEWHVVYQPDVCPYRIAEGDVVGVHYYGALGDTEQEFGASYRQGDDGIFEFTIENPQVIKGWIEPLLNACPGEKRHIYIPSEHAYGEKGEVGIPPDIDLITDVEVIYIKPRDQAGVTYTKEKRELKVDPTYVPPACEYHAKNGDLLFMEYHGTLETTGKVFDSSYNRGATFDFVIGHREAIDGWEKGMLGICAGERRHLVIPSDYAYGDQGTGDGSIPPGDSLVQDVRCMKIKTVDGTVYVAEDETTIDDEESLYAPTSCAKKPQMGETVWVAYDGRLQANIDIVFDTSLKHMYGRTQPFVFTIGARQAIQGFEDLIKSMCLGEKKHAVIPPGLAYGRRGDGMIIPPDARLDYIVEIVRIDDVDGKSSYAQAEYTVVHKPEGECEKFVENDDFIHVQWNGYFQVTFESFQASDPDNDEVIQLGKNQLFPELEANIMGMCIGEKRQIIIPQESGFGADGMASLKIPPFTTLVYDIEVMNIVKVEDHEEL